MAPVRQTPQTRRCSSDRHGHHRDPSTDPPQDAATTEREKGQESTTGVSLCTPDRRMTATSPTAASPPPFPALDCRPVGRLAALDRGF
jgi:hypothetical protein